MTIDNGTQYRTPLFAKMLIMVQSLVIIFFGYWMYQEYTYNVFFQDYVNEFIGANMLLLIAACGAVGFLGTGMFVRSRGRNRSIELVTDSGSNGAAPHEPSMRGGKLDTHTEQALIDMIRKTVPPSSSTTSSSASSSSSAPAVPASEAAASSGKPLPTLQRVEPNRKTP